MSAMIQREKIEESSLSCPSKNVANCFECFKRAYLEKAETQNNPQMVIRFLRLLSGCFQSPVDTQAGRVTPPPVPTRFCALRLIRRVV
jgi:hypothetical protein